MVFIYTWTVLGLLASGSLTQDISLLNKSTTCDAQCKQLALNAAQWERTQHARDPPDSFYDTPAEWGPNTTPGTLLRVEEHTNLTNYLVPSGLTMSRFLYASQDLNGTTVLASAFALWPYEVFDYAKGIGQNTSPNATYPAIAWSHGTTGLYQICAPSNYKALQYQFMSTFNLAFEGFAVIATDYAGLGASARPDGSKQPHQWIASPSGANDVAFAMEAARKAWPARLPADGPFVAMGHSQGGVTAWSFAERQAKKPLAGYKGTIAFSPAVNAINLITGAVQQAVNGVPVPASAFQLLPLISQAITNVYPSFNNAAVSGRIRDLLLNVAEPLQACLPTFSAILSSGFTTEEYIQNPEWINRTEVTEWGQRTAISGHEFASPMMVILGEIDATTPAAIEEAIANTCAVAENKGKSLEYLQMGAMGHFGEIQASRARWLQWVKDRMSEKPLNNECGGKTIVPGIDTNYTSFVGQFPPNWLVEGPGATEPWKLTL